MSQSAHTTTTSSKGGSIGYGMYNTVDSLFGIVCFPTTTPHYSSVGTHHLRASSVPLLTLSVRHVMLLGILLLITLTAIHLTLS